MSRALLVRRMMLNVMRYAIELCRPTTPKDEKIGIARVLLPMVSALASKVKVQGCANLDSLDISSVDMDELCRMVGRCLGYIQGTPLAPEYERLYPELREQGEPWV